MTKTLPILRPILNVADVALQPQGHGESFVVIAGCAARPAALSALGRHPQRRRGRLLGR